MLEQSKQFLKGSGQLLSPTKKAELDSKMSILEARWGRLQAELDNRYMRLVRIHEKLTNFEELLHPFLVWFVLFFKIIIIVIIYYFYFYLKNCIKKWNISKKCPQFFFYLTNGKHGKQRGQRDDLSASLQSYSVFFSRKMEFRACFFLLYHTHPFACKAKKVEIFKRCPFDDNSSIVF